MAVHNGEPHVHSAIESILNQTFTHWEFIIIDDGSTDGTLDLINKYQKTDSRIKVFSIPRCGLTRALNVGLSNCTGQYIARLDADDISLDSRLSLQHKWISSCETNVLVGCRLILKHGNNTVRRWTGEYPTNIVVLRRHLEFRNVFSHSSIMFCREIKGKRIFYDERFRYAQDYELVTRLAKFGRISNMKDKLVVFQLGGDKYLREQKTSVVKVALANKFPELDYLKDKSGVDFKLHLVGLSKNKCYAPDIKFLEFIHENATLVNTIRPVSWKLIWIFYRNYDLVWGRLLRGLNKVTRLKEILWKFH